MNSNATKLVRDPLYRQVYNLLKTEVLAKRSGDFLGTEGDLSRRFSVSIVTIRQALVKLAEDGLIERKRGRGTYVAVQTPSPRHVGILIEADISSENFSRFYVSAMQVLRKRLLARGYASRPYLGFVPQMVEPSELTCQDLLDDLTLKRLRGVVALHARACLSWVERLKEQRVPLVGHGPYDWSIRCPDEAILRLVLSKFRVLGRKRLAVIGWDDDHSRRQPLHSLLEKLLPQFGFEVIPQMFQLRAHGSQVGMGWQAFRDMWTCGLPKPDALLIYDDTLFEGCMQAVAETRLQVPRDLDIALFTSDWFQDASDIPLIKVGFRLEDMADALIDLLAANERGEKAPADISYPIVELPRPAHISFESEEITPFSGVLS